MHCHNVSLFFPFLIFQLHNYLFLKKIITLILDYDTAQKDINPNIFLYGRSQTEPLTAQNIEETEHTTRVMNVLHDLERHFGDEFDKYTDVEPTRGVHEDISYVLYITSIFKHINVIHKIPNLLPSLVCKLKILTFITYIPCTGSVTNVSTRISMYGKMFKLSSYMVHPYPILRHRLNVEDEYILLYTPVEDDTLRNVESYITFLMKTLPSSEFLNYRQEGKIENHDKALWYLNKILTGTYLRVWKKE